MGRTVEDVARVFNVVAGYDPADPYTEAGRGRAEEDYTAFLNADGARGARIGVLRALADPEETDGEISQRSSKRPSTTWPHSEPRSRTPSSSTSRRNWGREGMFCRRFRYDMWVYLRSLGPAAPMTDVLEVLEDGRYSDYAQASLRRNEGAPLDVHPSEWDEPCPDYAENEGRQAYLASLVNAMD